MMKQKLCFDGSLCVTARHEAVQNDLDYNKYLNNLHPEVIGFKVK